MILKLQWFFVIPIGGLLIFIASMLVRDYSAAAYMQLAKKYQQDQYYYKTLDIMKKSYDIQNDNAEYAFDIADQSSLVWNIDKRPENRKNVQYFLDAAQKNSPYWSNPALTAALIHEIWGDYSMALQNIDRFLKLKPNHAQGWLLKGKYLEKISAQNKPAALAAYLQADYLQPNEEITQSLQNIRNKQP